MVITDVNQVTYTGDGINTAWPFTFRIIEATDIRLIVVDTDGAETDITSDYYVDMVNSTVYYPGYAPGAEPPEADQPPVLQSGEKIIIYRSLPVTQEKDLGDKWPFNVIELALDKLTMLIQDWRDVLNRCLKVRVSDTQEGFDATITPEPGMAIQFKQDGTGFECVEPPSEVLAECKEVLADTKVEAASAAQSAGNSAQSASNSYASQLAAAQSAGDAAQSAGSAAQSLELAEADLVKVEGYIAAAKNVGLWDEDTTYQPGEAVMTEDGSVYRCLQETTGEAPASHPLAWAITQTVKMLTFEMDSNGDLMPLLQPASSSNWEIDGNGDIEPAL